MAQSKRHVYSRVSGPDLRWPREGCWERPGACGHGCGGWGDRLELGRATRSPDGQAAPASPPGVGDRRGPTFDFIWASGQRLAMGDRQSPGL